jgi:hypothetical protein
MSAADNIPDSTRQVIVNNYYETTEYYQVPYYHRYSLLWDSYYWDPFYYDYGYYHWRPYYWYGHYYYYNPHNHYWYYYDRYYPWHSGSWTGGGSENGDKQRIHKPGYNVLTTSGSPQSLPFVSGANDNDRITKPVKKIGVDLNSDVNNNDGYYSTSKPRIESVGKTTVGNNRNTTTYGKSSNKDTYKKPSSTTYSTKKQSSRSQSSSTHSSSSSSKSSKSSNTSSTSNKNSRNESSSSSSKKSK